MVKPINYYTIEIEVFEDMKYFAIFVVHIGSQYVFVKIIITTSTAVF